MITFPEYTGDKGIYSEGDWHFVGWSTDSQANEAGDGHYTQTVYRPGDTYRIPDDRQSDIDFYAIWAQENVKANFYIRLDGTIPTEPQSHAHSSYTTGITIPGALKSATFYTNSTEGVSSQLAKQPAESQIREQLRAKNINYNSETQYILWYVIKYENDGGDNHNWHVDGVLLDKEKVNLAYNPNCNTGEWIGGTMPDGSQYIRGAEATVSDKTPERHGYTFVGWNTAADGSGTSYDRSAQFTINEDTTLYAQWSEKGSVLLTYIANEGGSVSRGFESVAPATGNPQESEATPASGYRFVNWTLGDTNAEVSTNTILTKDVIDQYAKSAENLYVAQTFKANFERDPEQKKNLSYIVKHKVDGTVKNTFTEEITVQVLQPNTLTRNLEKEADQNYPGYVKDTVTYENGTLVTGTSIPNGAVIVVTYKVDDSQKKTLSYTVKHKVNGTVRDTFTEETKVQVLRRIH
ncbi:MAG: InlB B-repeat-containing protein [Enterocloster sp.]